MGVRLAGVAALVAAAISAFGCASRNDERQTFDCGRGFRATDWRDDPLKTGQSIAKCDWLDGWSQERVRRALGRPTFGHGPRYMRWDIGICDPCLGPTMWRLTIKQTAKHGPVRSARTATGPF